MVCGSKSMVANHMVYGIWYKRYTDPTHQSFWNTYCFGPWSQNVGSLCICGLSGPFHKSLRPIHQRLHVIRWHAHRSQSHDMVIVVRRMYMLIRLWGPGERKAVVLGPRAQTSGTLWFIHATVACNGAVNFTR